MDCYPKILVINEQSMHKENATGITLRSLFHDWPENRLMELSLDTAPMKTCVPNHAYATYPNHYLPLRSILMGGLSQSINKRIKVLISSERFPNIPAPNYHKLSLGHLRQFVYALTDASPICFSKGVFKAVRAFCPNVIYTLGGSLTSLKLTYMYSMKLDLNIVVHFMDNWPESLQWNDNCLLTPYHHALKRWLLKCLRRSILGMTISPQMANHYKELFGIDHYSIMNSVNVKEMECRTRHTHDDFTFCYAGGLHLNRWKAIREIQDALIMVGRKHSYRIRLNIFTGIDDRIMYENLFDKSVVQFKEYVSHEQIREVYCESDVLVHAETYDPVLLGFFKYSISTKIPEYLASNRPVLFYGPPEMGIYKYLKDNGAAYVCSKKGDLYGLILRIIKDKGFREVVVNNARKLALLNHDHQSTSNAFRVALQKASIRL